MMRDGYRSFLAARRRAACGLALLLGLATSSTMVLAYADLLPQAVLPQAAESDASGGLPRVALRLTGDAPLRIVAFGSSSTEGIGATSPASSYPARLEAALRQAHPGLAGGITVLNRGVGGEHADDMIARLDRDVLAARPDLVIWQTGSNDPLRGVSLDHFREVTLAGVRRMRDAGSDVVLMEPQWCPKLDATPGAYRFRDAVREIGAELGVPVIRRSDLMRDWVAEGRLTREQLFASDGLHMADRGYDLLGQAVADEVARRTGPAAVAAAQPGA